MIDRDNLGVVDQELGGAVISLRKNHAGWDRLNDLSSHFPMVTAKIDRAWRYHNEGYKYKEIKFTSASYGAATEAAEWVLGAE